ncbi:5272_t:CDS:2 [Rhizophagus irregularis]|nr:5272_t:CDS:2 [Rhizophagus irregularis]
MLEHNDRFSLNSLFENFTEESEELEDDISSDNEGSDCEFFGSFADFDECNIRFLHRISENIDVTSSSDSDIYEDEINEDLECENECNNEQSPYISKGLEFLGNWLIDISRTQDEELKKQILVALVNTLIPFAPHSYYNKETNNPIPISTSKITQPPSDLVDIFGMSDPLSHDLFQEYQPTELHHQGVELYRQEVLEIECRNTHGRRAIEVVRTRLKDFTQQKKNRRTKVKLSQGTSRTGGSRNADNLELSHLPNDQISLLKKKRKQTTPEEEKILEALLVYEDELPDSAINEVLDKLSSDWNKTKVKAAWRYLTYNW